MLAILPALALVQPYNLRGEDINVTIGPHPGGFPHHVENVTYDCRSEIELCRELFDAVEMGDRAEVARLIDAGADVDYDAGGGRGAPLRNAAKYGYTTIAHMLLRAGAEIDAASNMGHTALTYAAVANHYDTLKLLLVRGAALDREPDSHGEIADLNELPLGTLDLPSALRRVRLVIEAECAAEYAWIAAGNPPGGRDARNSGEPLAAADERIRVALRDIYLMSDEEMRAKQEEMGLLAFAAMVAAWLRSALDDGDRVDAAIGALQAAADAEPGSVNTTALAAAIEQARAVEVPTEVIDEAKTVLKEAMKLQDRIVP
jgi:hypothetical protein